MEALECCGQFMSVAVEAPGITEMRCGRCGDVVYVRKVAPLLRVSGRR